MKHPGTIWKLNPEFDPEKDEYCERVCFDIVETEAGYSALGCLEIYLSNDPKELEIFPCNDNWLEADYIVDYRGNICFFHVNII